METYTIKSLVERIRETVRDINMINAKIPGTYKNPGLHSSYLKSITLKNKKIKDLFKKLEDIIEGNIITVIYKRVETDEIFKRCYTNITQDDVKYYLQMMAHIGHYNIVILEIREVSTQNTVIKL